MYHLHKAYSAMEERSKKNKINVPEYD